MSVKDSTGSQIQIGDMVRVLASPDLSGMPSASASESMSVFNHIVGRYKKVKGFDEDGRVELVFRIRGGVLHGLHTVWIEPALLRLRKVRSNE